MSNIEEEIKQGVFADEIQKAVINMIYTHNWAKDEMNTIFKDYGILFQHYNVMRIVRGKKGDPVCPGEILSVMIDKGRDLTRLVDKLVKSEFLIRQTCDTNRRKVDILITELGLKITQEIEEKLDDWTGANKNLTNDEAIELNRLLNKLRS